MRSILQRVTSASVFVDKKMMSEISSGLLVLLGICQAERKWQVKYLAHKCLDLRIFSDQDGKLNLSPIDVNAEIMVVSNFTLYRD